jgi:hypothetical protein
VPPTSIGYEDADPPGSPEIQGHVVRTDDADEVVEVVEALDPHPFIEVPA